jgi:hypothetical protein
VVELEGPDTLTTKDGVMKNIIVLLSAVFIVVIGTSANGEVYEFDLPELAGLTADTSLTTTFVYNGPGGNINSLSARVIGTVDYLGLVECFGTPPDTSLWPIDIGTALSKPGDTGRWSGSPDFLVQLGPFDETYIHHTFNNGFSTIADGDTVEVEFYFYPAILVGISAPITAPSTGTLSSASILLDVSVPAPVKETTWGSIKELFH